MVNGPEDVSPCWDAMDWRAREDDVRRLRQRIFKATRDQRQGSIAAAGPCP